MRHLVPSLRALAAFAVIAALVTLGGCASSPGGTGGGSAACEAPRITVTPAIAAAGDEVVIRGEAWGPCNDTPHDPPEPEPASTGVSLEWTLGTSSWEIGTVDVDGSTFEHTARVPADTGSGGLMLTAMESGDSGYVARTPLTISDPARDPERADTVLYEGLIRVHYGFIFASSVRDEFGPDLANSLRGQSNGLLGGAVPGFLYMATGTHTGEIPLRVVVHDAEPPVGDAEEVVEVSFRPETPEVTLRSFDDGVDLWLPVDDYRARWRVWGLDAGRDQDLASEDDPAPDRYELALWPAPPAADSVVRVTGEEARLAHDQLARD